MECFRNRLIDKRYFNIFLFCYLQGCFHLRSWRHTNDFSQFSLDNMAYFSKYEALESDCSYGCQRNASFLAGEKGSGSLRVQFNGNNIRLEFLDGFFDLFD